MEGRFLSTLRPSQIYRPEVMEDIHIKAELGRYRFRGFGTLRPRPLPSFDDLTFIPCSLTRIPLEGYRERCSTKTVLGTRYATRPIQLDIPVIMTGISSSIGRLADRVPSTVFVEQRSRYPSSGMRVSEHGMNVRSSSEGSGRGRNVPKPRKR